MNTAERIVEAYFRYCRDCLTIPDVKITGGNNRQIDLLAWNPKDKIAYHVESTVVPSARYFKKSASYKSPTAIFQNKFFAQPLEQQADDIVPLLCDPNYQKIQRTYGIYGFTSAEIKRVWVCWSIEDYTVNYADIISYFLARGISENLVELISFRDAVIPALEQKIGSSNYEDDVLRTFSFFAERDYQIKLQPTNQQSGVLPV